MSRSRHMTDAKRKTPESVPDERQALLERKVRELAEQLEKLPPDRQEQFRRELESEAEKEADK